jgi:hypothetical protein
VALLAWLTYGQPSMHWRIILTSLAMAAYNLRSAFLAWRRLPSPGVPRHWILIAALAGLGTFFLLRGLLTLLSELRIPIFMATDTLQALAFVASFTGHVLILTGLVFLNLQRLELELQSAQHEVRQLSGLLPICSHCKRIRDDGGYWHQVEQYISARSDADFTHGICPQCLTELYPELAASPPGNTGPSSRPPRSGG